MPTYYEDPAGLFKNVDFPVDDATVREMAATEAESVEAVLDIAVARGAIAMDERDAWRDRLRREPEMTTEIIGSLPGNDRLADRAFEQDPRIRDLGNSFDRYMGIEAPVREYDETAGMSQTELLYKRLAEMTNEHLFA